MSDDLAEATRAAPPEVREWPGGICPFCCLRRGHKECPLHRGHKKGAVIECTKYASSRDATWRIE